MANRCALACERGRPPVANMSGFTRSVAVAFARVGSAVVRHPALLEVSLGSRNMSEAPCGDITLAGSGAVTHTIALGR